MDLQSLLQNSREIIMKIVLILAISAICFAGEALPASTANAVKAYDAEMAKAKAEYDKRDEAARKVLVVALKKAQDAETKAGNLEGALAIKKRIEELTPDLLNNKIDVSKAIIGKWEVEGGYWDIKDNGKVESNFSKATWSIDNNSIILNQNSYKHVITILNDDTCEVIRSDGKRYNISRIK